eukprot:267772_1
MSFSSFFNQIRTLPHTRTLRNKGYKHHSWPTQTITSIGPRLCIKFSATRFKFGVKPVIQKNSALFPADIIQFIQDDFNQKCKDNIIDQYSNTMTLEFLSNTFNRWNDIKTDTIFVDRLRNFLTESKLIISKAINDKKLIHSRDIQAARAMRHQQLTQHQQHQTQIQSYDSKMQELNNLIESQKMVIDDQHELVETQKRIITKQNKKDKFKTKKINNLKRQRCRDKTFRNKYPVFIPKKQYNNLKHKERGSQSRANWNVKHNINIIGNTTIWMSVLSQYPHQYDSILIKQHDILMAKQANREIADRRHSNAAVHFIDTYNNKISQRGQQSLRNTLTYDINVENATRKKQKWKTSTGVVPDIIPSGYEIRKWSKEYIANLVQLGLAFYPILCDGTIDWKYYKNLNSPAQRPNILFKPDNREGQNTGRVLGSIRQPLKVVKRDVYSFLLHD